MAAWTWFEASLKAPGGWRRSVALLLMAVKPYFRDMYAGYYLAVLVGIFAGLLSVGKMQLMGAPQEPVVAGLSWSQTVERRLDDHETRLRDKTHRIAVLEQQNVENQRFHTDISGLHMSERLTSLETRTSFMTSLLGVILATLVPMAFEAVKRLLKK